MTFCSRITAVVKSTTTAGSASPSLPVIFNFRGFFIGASPIASSGSSINNLDASTAFVTAGRGFTGRTIFVVNTGTVAAVGCASCIAVGITIVCSATACSANACSVIVSSISSTTTPIALFWIRFNTANRSIMLVLRLSTILNPGLAASICGTSMPAFSMAGSLDSFDSFGSLISAPSAFVIGSRCSRISSFCFANPNFT